MERDPAWSPDGKSVAYFSDEAGEYALHVRPQAGTGDVVKIPLGEKPSIYFFPTWSPDSKRIAYIDGTRRSGWSTSTPAGRYGSIATGSGAVRRHAATRLVARLQVDGLHEAPAELHGRRLLYSVDSGKSTQVTDGMSDARVPVFDAEGKYLYFVASTDTGASLQPTSTASATRVGQHLPGRDVQGRSLPVRAESDEEKAADEKPAGDKPAGDKPADDKAAAEKPAAGKAQAEQPAGAKPGGEKPPAGKPAPKPVPVKLDFDGILQRILAVRCRHAATSRWQAGKPGVLLALESPSPFGGGSSQALRCTATI